MKITNLIENSGHYLKIEKAVWDKNYIIKLLFNNAMTIVVDFEEFLKNSHHPEIKKYLDLELFKQFAIVNGNLNWNDYDLIFPIEDLYTGNINHGIPLQVSAI